MPLTSKTRLGKMKLEVVKDTPVQKASTKTKAELLAELEDMQLIKELN